ncbi:MAG: hypothetical protein A3H98_03250 [Bacteroidetes bacterium RIFCSPLOWO2_02_FULL_36_8]|nr:MAG: hypothetical protein A3H98_03250 [Bacteroidetes bacterium RIFCSPLOWO2_02_FULL_36_8]OFY70525.1 MAG: hypothetical protein A3G23_09580 [Bacteroidetes bacterium RIFCSPLOWO2_12_FULL_37_12]
MPKTLLLHPLMVNEGTIQPADVLIENDKIAEIRNAGSEWGSTTGINVIDAKGLYLFPGIIDSHVHFREPGNIHKGDLKTESMAAVAGGVTSIMEMPNTQPPVTTLHRLEEKFLLAGQKCLANHSFYFGTDGKNMSDIILLDPKTCCGLKIYLGTTTGGLALHNKKQIREIFERCPVMIAAHCEDDELVQINLQSAIEKFGENIPFHQHAVIRSEEVCFISTKFAVELARESNAKLMVMHLSTEKELSLFENQSPLDRKKILSEVCVHHLWYDDSGYEKLNGKLKCNPSVKDEHHKYALRNALKNGTIDIVSTDHAPHTISEKQKNYSDCPSGLPLIQHSFNMMLCLWKEGIVTLEQIAEKMCHHPATCFNIFNRGFIRKNYFADLVLVDLKQDTIVKQEDILYKCDWSPLENSTLTGKIMMTYVNGNLVFREGKIQTGKTGKPLLFIR